MIKLGVIAITVFTVVFNALYLNYQVNVQQQEILSIKTVLVRMHAMQPDNVLGREVTGAMNSVNQFAPDALAPNRWPERKTN